MGLSAIDVRVVGLKVCAIMKENENHYAMGRRVEFVLKVFYS